MTYHHSATVADNLPQHEPMARHRVPKMRQTDRRFHHYQKENR